MHISDFLIIFKDTDILNSARAYYYLTDSNLKTKDVGTKSLVDENIIIKNREKIEELHVMTNYIITVISGTQRYSN